MPEVRERADVLRPTKEEQKAGGPLADSIFGRLSLPESEDDTAESSPYWLTLNG